jgi:presequence protease
MTDFVTGKKYSGFILKRSEFRSDMNSILMSFEHEKTGAKLTAVKNDDDNKTFCITFKTIPEDCTGVAHVLEHCVLSGSEKYPVKDVFSELYKGGLSTFMNAFTAPDSTYYPFSTRNLKEYFNFMSVYLDTTLRPLLKENTFLQEGWHYNIPDKDSPIDYEGIVYNEMKGAMSNPVSQMAQNISKTLFPCSTYSHNSGGDPEKITNLTYEYFKDFHKKYYHPSNSHTYIYGNADLGDELAFINDNYFRDFEKSDFKAEVACGLDIKPLATEIFYYPVGQSETKDKKTYISVSTKIGTPDQVELNIAMHLLTNILMNSDASPLKQAMMRSGIAGDFSGYFDDSQYETAVTAYISGSEIGHRDEFLKIYFETLKALSDGGIEKDLILSEINHIEFKQKEKEISSMRGLIYLNRIMHLTMYGIDVFANIDLNPVIARIREKALGSDFLEQIIKNYLLNEKRTAVVLTAPESGLSEKKSEEEKKKLADYRASLSEKEIEKLVERSAEFKQYQEAQNSEENIAKIPKLKITDIDRKAVLLVPKVEVVDGITYYINEMFTNDIVYLSLGFDLCGLSADLLPYIGIFTDLFKETGTKKRSYSKLFTDISTYFGGLDFALTIHDDFKDRKNYRPVLYLEIKTFKKFLPEVTEILTDVITGQLYDDRERIYEIISSRFLHKDTNLKSEGYDYPVTRLKACISERGKFVELIRGLTAYEEYKKIYDDFDESFGNLKQNIEEITGRVLNKNTLHIGLISDAEGIELTKKHCRELIGALSDLKPECLEVKLPLFKAGQAYLTSSDVVFNSVAGDFYSTGAEYSGVLEVVKNYISSDYLFDMIRLKGGAYGAWMHFNPQSGFMGMTSYRDPNVAKTFEAFRMTGEHLRTFKMDPSLFTSLKIGAYSAFDPLLSPYAKGKKSRDDLMCGITQEFLEKTICDLLNATQLDIRNTGEYFDRFVKNSYISSIGNAEKLKKDSGLFSELVEIL